MKMKYRKVNFNEMGIYNNKPIYDVTNKGGYILGHIQYCVFKDVHEGSYFFHPLNCYITLQAHKEIIAFMSNL